MEEEIDEQLQMKEAIDEQFRKKTKERNNGYAHGDATFFVQPSSVKHDTINLLIKNNKLPTTIYFKSSSSVHV